MKKIDGIQVLDDIELEKVVGGAAKKKVAKKKAAKKKHVKVTATSNGGSTVEVPSHVPGKANGLT